MRVAIIDIGTNTFNLLIAELHPQKDYEIIHQQKLPAKLGEGGINDELITPDAFQRGIDALIEHKKTLCEFNPSRVYAFATSAIRSCSNGEEFVDTIREKLDISIKVISGQQEASLIYHGIKQAVPLTEEKMLMLDIGGGSIEFIIADREQIFWKQSYKIGITRIMDMFLPCEPILKAEEEAIEDYIEIKIKSLYKAIEKFPVSTLIGSSGSFKTLSNMVFLRDHEPDEKDHNPYHIIAIDDYLDLHKSLLNSTLRQRREISGVNQNRLELIVVASILVNYVVRRFSISKLIQSRYALKEGIIARIMKNEFN